MVKCKIIDIPISDLLVAETAVNAELSKIKGTIISVNNFEDNRVMVIYK